MLNNGSNYMNGLADNTYNGLQQGQLGQYVTYNSYNVTIPVSSADWAKLSRETQIRILDELGILNAEVSGR